MYSLQRSCSLAFGGFVEKCTKLDQADHPLVDGENASGILSFKVEETSGVGCMSSSVTVRMSETASTSSPTILDLTWPR